MLRKLLRFKYVFNFCWILKARRHRRGLFERYIGPEKQFAEELYASLGEAREMQSAGMLIGGHTHSPTGRSHSLSKAEMQQDLRHERRPVGSRLRNRNSGPFVIRTARTIRSLPRR